ncbi:EAL domain-containing protein [Duganella sp. FT92W]|uniref:EAL domain-containing protein n=1 Tax=Pseudoduganella rivuli TaxID=2666085 RepID=A0A7X2IMZ6_9BURK|nr:EAL domain-containing protein [Pseudoduganella rivuli]MRV72800.1 EAL domain-containing protein [Pseudoduganella rivuli]
MRFPHPCLLLLGLAMMGCTRPGMAAPDPASAWRDDVAQTRILAENDLPRALGKATRLLAALPSDAAPADRARALNLLARTEANLGQTAEAERHARQALDLAAKSDDRVGQAEAELNIVITSVNTARIDAMLAAAKHSVELLKGVDRPDLLGEALLRMAMMYYRYDMLPESVAMAMQSMDIAHASHDPLVLAYSHQGLAFVYRFGGHFRESAEHYEHMRQQARLAHSALLEMEALLGLAMEKARQDDLAGAEQLTHDALLLARDAGAPFYQNTALYTLAEFKRRQQRYDDAQRLLDEVLSINARYPNPLNRWYALGARSINAEAQGRMAAARADAAEAYAVAKTIDIRIYLGESTKRLAALAAADGNQAQAYKLLAEANELMARATREKLGTQMLELARHYKSESKQREIDELTRRNRQQTDELRWRTLQQRWLWTVAAGSCAMLAGLAYFLVRLRRSKQQIDLLNAGLELRVHERTATLRQRTRYMRTLFDMLPLWVWLKDTEGRYLSANQPSAETHGQPVEAMIGKTDYEWWPHARADLVRADELEVMATRQRKTVEREEWLPGASRPAWIQTYHAPVLDDDGTVLGTVGVARDISDIRQRLRVGAKRARAFELLAQGGKLDEVLAQVAAYVEEAGTDLRCTITLLDDGAPEVWPDGDWVEPIRDAAGKVLGYIVIHRDVPTPLSADECELFCNAGNLAAIAIERKRIEEQLRHQAAYDMLTGLPNRRMFGDRLREEVARAGRSGGMVAVMFIDLDHFKDVNDSLGHHMGDRLLVEVAARLRTCVRTSDVVARLGGDEFVVILPDHGDTASLRRIAQTILDVVRRPLQLDGHTAYVSGSIGIASYPADAGSVEQLTTYADRAMYAAKEEGRNAYRFFTPPMHQQAKSRLLLANDLRQALADGQLQIWLQPIVDLSTGRVCKAEALLRWQHPVHGMVPPGQFIPIAEETGIIVELGNWIFRQAAAAARQWLEQGDGAPCQVSVNVSPRQFVSDTLVDTCLAALRELDVPPHSMVIEITEGLLLTDRADIVDKLARLRSAGMQLALDDFGTGYSAMAYLKKFNIDYLKVDRSFVRDLDADPSDKAIAEAIIVMAHKLGLKTIAEGVETVAQRDLLALVGCDMVQGYLYARPMPVAEFLASLRSEGAAVAA